LPTSDDHGDSPYDRHEMGHCAGVDVSAVVVRNRNGGQVRGHNRGIKKCGEKCSHVQERVRVRGVSDNRQRRRRSRRCARQGSRLCRRQTGRRNDEREETAVWSWIVETLRASPELAIFLALAVGFWIGPKKLGGFSLGNLTETLLAAVAIGQLGITISGPIKSTFFLLFLFAVGYGVGPQFFAGLGRDGPKQI